MQTIRVHTTQNVFIHYPLASVGDRILAYLIDQLIIITYAIAGIALFIKMNVEQWWIWLVAIGFPFLFYSLVCEVLLNGQSPGKMAMKVKVVRLDGTPPGLGDYLLRWIFRFVDFFILSGAVAMIVISAGRKGQRVGDIAAGTSVVKLTEQKEITSNDLFVVTEDNYVPEFIEAVNLTSRDIELIQQALEVNVKHGNNKPAHMVTEKIKALLNIQSDHPPVKFLYTIVRDYNHLSSKAS